MPILLLLLLAAPVVPVAPQQPGRQDFVRLGCDEAGCVVSWVAVRATSSAWSATVSRVDGSVSKAVTMNDDSRGANVEGLGVGAGLRVHLLDTQGRAGDYTLYVSLMRADSGAIDALGARPLYPHSGAGSPARSSCAFGQSLFFCVLESGVMYNDLFFRRISADGGALDAAGTELLTGPSHSGNPTVVTLGDRFGAAWEDRFDANQYDVHAAVVAADGAVVAQQIIVSALPESEVDVVSTPYSDGALLAWTHQVTPPEIAFAQLSRDGSVQKPMAPLSNASAPAIAWQSNRLFVAFERTFDAGTHVETRLLEWPSGVALAPRFVSTGADDRSPVVTPIDDGRVLLAYQVNPVDGGDARLVVTTVGTRLSGEPCVTDSQCAGLTCGGGICGPALDAGIAADGGVDLTPHWIRVGCGCGSTAPGVSAALLLLWLCSSRRAMAPKRGRR